MTDSLRISEIFYSLQGEANTVGLPNGLPITLHVHDIVIGVHAVDYQPTVSCYSANAQGQACGVCDACRLRKIGFEQTHVKDPTRYQPH